MASLAGAARTTALATLHRPARSLGSIVAGLTAFVPPTTAITRWRLD